MQLTIYKYNANGKFRIAATITTAEGNQGRRKRLACIPAFKDKAMIESFVNTFLEDGYEGIAQEFAYTFGGESAGSQFVAFCAARVSTNLTDRDIYCLGIQENVCKSHTYKDNYTTDMQKANFWEALDEYILKGDNLFPEPT